VVRRPVPFTPSNFSLIDPVSFVKIDPKIFNFPLHGFIFHADLNHLDVFELTQFLHQPEYFAVENCQAIGAAIFGQRAHIVDVEPVSTLKKNLTLSGAKGLYNG